MSDLASVVRYTNMQHSIEILRKRAESLAQVDEVEAAAEMLSLLLFRLGEEWYAVRIMDVREIYNDFKMTHIPRLPDFVLGVINVRGEIISVTDIAVLMRIASDGAAEEQVPSAIVVSTDRCVSALVVDEIGDIIEVRRDAIEPPLSTLERTQAEFISGSVFVEGRLIGIVNLDKVLEPIGEKA